MRLSLVDRRLLLLMEHRDQPTSSNSNSLEWNIFKRNSWGSMANKGYMHLSDIGHKLNYLLCGRVSVVKWERKEEKELMIEFAHFKNATSITQANCHHSVCVCVMGVRAIPSRKCPPIVEIDEMIRHDYHATHTHKEESRYCVQHSLIWCIMSCSSSSYSNDYFWKERFISFTSWWATQQWGTQSS